MLRFLNILACILLFQFVSFATEDKVIVAKRGDGIYSILQQNNLLPLNVYMNEFIRINKSKIGKNNSLYVGASYTLPSKKKVELKQSKSLLGPKYKDVKVVDNQLSNATFYLVSGHGGPDPGALGRFGSYQISEDEYAYDVTLRLGRELMRHGARVHYIIQDANDGIRDERYLKMDKDETCSPNQKIPLDQLKRLDQRTERVNELYIKESKSRYNRALIIHVDARKSHKNIDIFFYHFEKSWTGKRLAYTLRKTMEQKYRAAQPNRGYQGTVSPRSLYLVNKTYPPAVYIELGNINNSRDQKRLTVADNRQAIANWMCDGIITDYKKGKY